MNRKSEREHSFKYREILRISHGWLIDSDWCCDECGIKHNTHKTKYNRPIFVHHKDLDHYNDEIDNLSALCLRCHGIKHLKRAKARRREREGEKIYWK